VDIPGVGAYVAFMDTEGNRVSMLEPLPVMKAKGRKKTAGKAKAAARTKKGARTKKVAR